MTHKLEGSLQTPDIQYHVYFHITFVKEENSLRMYLLMYDMAAEFSET